MNQFENTVLFLTGLVGLILIYVMLTSVKSNKFVNGFLIFNFVIASTRFIVLSTYNLHFQNLLQDFVFPYRVFLLLTFPSSYLYAKALVNDCNISLKTILKHLIFPILLFIVNLIGFLNLHQISDSIISINFCFSVCYSIFYLFKIFTVCYKNLWSKKLEISGEHYQVMKNWTIFYYIVCTLLTVRLVTSFIYENSLSYTISGSHVSYIFAAMVWLLMFVRIFKTPEILYGIPKLAIKTRHFEEVKVQLSDAWSIYSDEIQPEKDLKLREKLDFKIIDLIQEVEFAAQEEQIFKNPKATMFDLALKVGVPESHLNYLFRYHSNLSFQDYKNNMRIAYSISMIENGHLSKNTLESLAKDVGFSSYSPFYKAFKKIIGIGPNEYFISLTAKQV